MLVERMSLSKKLLLSFILSLLINNSLLAQSSLSITDQNVVSPNGSTTQSTSLYTGAPGFSIPIYTVACGRLSLPVSLNYGYGGFQPNQDAGWTGLGWELQTGGVITKSVQGQVDGSRLSGYNYGDYSIKDSLGNSSFLAKINSESTSSYDVAPDIYTCSFNGYSASFYWYKNKAYFLSYNKELQISLVGGYFVITTGDGTVYTFGQAEGILFRYTTPMAGRNYSSAYYLTSVVSSDKKDSIVLTYSVPSYIAPVSTYYASYPQGTYNDDPPLSVIDSTPVDKTPLIQSIRCKNSRVDFISDPTLRTDQMVAGPKLREIDVRDSITQKIVKKNLFSYEYFNLTTTSPNLYERLKLKTFSYANPQISSDSQTYRFAYLQEYASFPMKGTSSLDDWGYFNNRINGQLILKTYDQLGRLPNFTYCSYAALDSIYLPTGGVKTYQYEQNDYDSGSTQHHALGPGIRVKSQAEYLSGSAVPATALNYSYLADDGTSSSGVLANVTTTSGPITIVDVYDYNKYVLANNNPGSDIRDNIFFYAKVSQNGSAGKDKHKSDYYFKSFSNRLEDIDLLKQIDYRYDSTTTLYSKMSVTTNEYDSTGDTTFLYIHPFVDSSHSNDHVSLMLSYAYTYDYNITYWRRLKDQLVTQFDILNDSTSAYTFFNYNSVRNMDSSRQTLADGNAIITKYKRVDDYTSSITGGLISHHIINPAIETQTWLQHSAGTPAMVSGSVVSYDTTIFRVKATYALEPSSPLTTLNNETLTSGKYNTLLSDNTNYILKAQMYYDGNNNLSYFNKTSDVSNTILYGYNNSHVTAEISNASPTTVAFTSFENGSATGWSIPDTVRNRTNSMTGSQCYNLVTGKTIAGVVSGSTVQYILSYWSTTTSATVTANGTTILAGPSGLTKNGWTYHEHIIPSSSVTVNITATNILIDELRLYPSNAQMTTYTFDPLIGKTSVCSPNNLIAYYEYDGFNRIKDIKDMDRNTVKLYDYQYNQGYNYKNDLKTGGFIKNDCPCNFTSTITIIDTVVANTYTSHSSKWDANQLALNDINANGQNNANAKGTCSAISCSGVDKHIAYCTTCLTGTKVYTASVYNSPHNYTCYYHYEFADGYIGPTYSEFSGTACTILN